MADKCSKECCWNFVRALARRPAMPPLLDPSDPAEKIARALRVAGAVIGNLALLILRLGWGLELVQSGWGHLHHVDQTAKFFTDIGVPFPRANVYISGGTELIGGVLWMAGLGTRLISMPLFFNFCIAFLTASKDKLANFVHAPTDIVDDSAFPFWITSLVLLAFGPGWISLDGVILAVIRWTIGSTPPTPKT
jgi:putative oxidoreductase